MGDSLGGRLVRAAAAGDFQAAGLLLHPDVEFRALTPERLFEATGPGGVMAILKEWYSPAEAVEALESHVVVDQPAVRYRVRWSAEGEGTFVFEQQAYYDVDDGRIARLRLVCSGDRPVPA